MASGPHDLRVSSEIWGGEVCRRCRRRTHCRASEPQEKRKSARRSARWGLTSDGRSFGKAQRREVLYVTMLNVAPESLSVQGHAGNPILLVHVSVGLIHVNKASPCVSDHHKGQWFFLLLTQSLFFPQTEVESCWNRLRKPHDPVTGR